MRKPFYLIALFFLVLLAGSCASSRTPEAAPQNPHAFVRDSIQDAMLSSLVPLDTLGRAYMLRYTASYDLDGMMRHSPVSMDEMMSFVASKLLRDFPVSSLKAGAGCSSFTAYTPEKDFIFARNYDFRHEPCAVVLLTEPENGYRSIGMADAGWLHYTTGQLDDGKTDLSFLVALPYATVDGMNEKGVTISVMQLETNPTEQSDPEKLNMVTTSAIRLILDRAANVDEAVSLWKAHNMHSAVKNSDFHFLLADASGRTVVLEYINGELKVLEGRNFVANEYLTPGHGPAPETSHRYSIMRAALTPPRDTVCYEDARSILRLVRQGQYRKGAPTQWSAIYNLSRKSLNVSVYNDFSQTYTFSFDDFAGQ